MSEASIMVKELIPIVAAAALWGRIKVVRFNSLCRCDNGAMVAAITSRISHEKQIMYLLRCLFFLEASFDCHLTMERVKERSSG